jgi:dihydroorotase
MKMSLEIIGRIINADKIIEGSVEVDEKDGKIIAVRQFPVYGKEKNRFIFPGFIDLHTHLREDASGKWNYKEDFETGTRAALRGGVTAVVDMPNTPDAATNLEALTKKKEIAKKKAKIEVFFYAGVTADQIGKLKKFRDEAMGYKIYTCESTGNIFIKYEDIEKALDDIMPTGKPVSFHCEDQGINDIMKKKFENECDSKIHSKVRPSESEFFAVNNVLKLCKKDYRINICHVSTKDAMNLVKNYKEINSKATLEVTLHHLFFNSESAKNNFFKVNPPLRSESDRKFLLQEFNNGKIDFLVTDHAPHTAKEKQTNYWQAPSGIGGLDVYGNVVGWLLEKGTDPRIIARCCSYNPSNFLGLKDRGEIKIGNLANLTVINLAEKETISLTKMQSKSAVTSPYVGLEFPKVEMVVIAGKVAMQDGKISDRL